jgi:hypothetical protein
MTLPPVGRRFKWLLLVAALLEAHGAESEEYGDLCIQERKRIIQQHIRLISLRRTP